MGYLHIQNLYRDNNIQLFRECWALEKIHGTSAHIRYDFETKQLHLFSGEQQGAFESLFDREQLAAQLDALGGDIVIYGEAYGGKIQKQSERYGPALKFVAFDVKRGERWLVVPEACSVVQKLSLEFVYYTRTNTDTTSLNILRDDNSVQAQRNGCGVQKAEGIILRPLIELQNHAGERVIAKHKRDDFRETFQPRKVGEPLEVLQAAEAIAHEWVTPMRLAHVLQKIPGPHTIAHTSEVIGVMLEDVLREAKGEIVDSRPTRKAIASNAAILFKNSLKVEPIATL